ncbi:carbohydrate kinase family protein [Sunxiuqinia sp. A32]|uniref:carbohydrate kinase family protein n=1 Tax=Sunxiuqinia sp. A32 TaxID=3461496 RepID=UPI0040457A91
MAKTILAFGELLWDLLPSGKVLGGAPANFIFRINSFGDKGYLVTRLGNDELGDEALSLVKGLNLSTENIQTDEVFPTGTVEVKLDENGVPDFNIIKDVAYDHIELTSEMIQLARKADCLCFGTLIQRYGISKNTLRELILEAPQAIKFLDVNLRKDCYTLKTITESLNLTNILKINDDELIALKDMLGLKKEVLRDMAQEMLEKFDKLEIILVTLGSKGAFVLSADGEYFYDPGYKVKLADTVGSGDACSAGFVHSYLKGRSLAESLKLGNAAGAMVASMNGATQPISKDEIIAFMEQKDIERVSI